MLGILGAVITPVGVAPQELLIDGLQLWCGCMPQQRACKTPEQLKIWVFPVNIIDVGRQHTPTVHAGQARPHGIRAPAALCVLSMHKGVLEQGSHKRTYSVPPIAVNTCVAAMQPHLPVQGWQINLPVPNQRHRPCATSEPVTCSSLGPMMLGSTPDWQGLTREQHSG